MHNLDILIPVYNEGENIIEALETIRQSVKTPFAILICYDRDEDTTLTALKNYPQINALNISYVKNQGQGVADAVFSGFRASTAPAVMVYCADDFYNAHLIDPMYQKYAEGSDIVIGCRFMPGGCMIGFPRLKSTLVTTAAFTLNRLARISTKDPTNGVRIYSRELLNTIELTSRVGWSFNLEMIIKAERAGARISELPFRHMERTRGATKFQVVRWLPHYLKWYFYAFLTVFNKPTVFSGHAQTSQTNKTRVVERV